MRGAQAEDDAFAFLQRQGLRPLMRNYRCRGGELDLVMEDRGTVAVIEVRQRRRADYGTAAETIGPRKRARIILATRMLLAQRPELARRPLRFDVIALDGADNMEWIRSAFDAT